MALPAPPRLAAKLLLWGASASLLAAQHAAADQRAHPITAHLAARILPADAPPIDTGVLLEQGGKILALGPRSSTPIPKDAKVQQKWKAVLPQMLEPQEQKEPEKKATK